ncbi:MAG: DUF1569 domain-containing protein [Bacteroidia bacterium]|nr:DUF1569 domain-containing protein [Bacteroidia bacterium]
MKSVFNQEDVLEIIHRIQKLNADSRALWGKMDVAQMLAHCNVTYEMAYENVHPKPNALMRFILKLFVKNKVVGENTYPKNNPTAPQFVIKGEKNFETEKKRLISYLQKTQQLGENHFEGKESHSFGSLNKTEWNNMFYKHLDHHLTQFGV